MEQENQFDIGLNESEFVVIHGNSYLKTPKGNIVSHRNIRLIQRIIRQFSLPFYKDYPIKSYEIFSFISDNSEKLSNFLNENIITLIQNDPVLKFKEFPTSSNFNYDSFTERLEENQNLLNFFYFGSSIILKSLNKLLIENNIAPSIQNIQNENLQKLASLINSLSIEEKACIIFLTYLHKSGILLPFMLVNNIINDDEYANALFSINFYKSYDTTNEYFNDNLLEALNIPLSYKLDINDGNFFEIIINSTREVRDYLLLIKDNVNQTQNLSQLIKQGESTYLEFKSTLRWNLRVSKKDPAIEHANLKTITAFLNSSGGILLIGVRDDGSIEGIETDAFTDGDKFLLHLWNLIKSSIGEEFCPFIETKLEKQDGKTICIVKCFPSNRPAFLKQTGFDAEFYIRTGPSSSKLDVLDALKYISDRFEYRKF